MSDTKQKIMTERIPEEATLSTPPNGHLLATKSTHSDEASITPVSPDNQCSSTSPSFHQSALTGSTKQGDETVDKQSSDKSVSSHSPLDHIDHENHCTQAGSLSLNSHRKTNDVKPLRCELCNKFFSEADFDSQTANAAPLTKKITVCPDCNQKIPDTSRMAPPSQTKNPESALPTAGNSSAHINNTMAARSSQCCCKASHQSTTSQIPTAKSDTISTELLRTIKTEPPSEPYATACTAQDSNPHTYHNHTYQTKCSIYLTANLKPCGKRDKEAVAGNKDSSSSGDQNNKKPKLDNSKDPSLEKGQYITSEPVIKSEIISPDDCSADVKPLVSDVKPSSNGHAKIEIKQEPIPTESCKSSFKFKSPTKPAPISASVAATSHKTKISCASNTYMFEGCMLWKPVHPEPAQSTPAPKAEGGTEMKSETPSSTEKKETDENTFCCEGSLFIKPVLPNEFAFEGTMYIKPDSPLLAQAPFSFTNLPSASGSSSMPQTTKTVTIQSVFTNSGQVISSITHPSGDKSEHASSNGKPQKTQHSTVVTTNCSGGGKCTLTSCCTNQFTTTTTTTKESELKSELEEKTEQVEKTSAGLSQCNTSGGVGGGGGHTDFSVKSILSTTGRRSSCDTRRFQQH